MTRNRQARNFFRVFLGKKLRELLPTIKSKVTAADSDGVASDLIFSVAGKEVGASPVMVLRNNSIGVHQLTGSIIVTGDIQATSLNVTSITSSIVTSSIVQTYGSNIFGDAASDSQTFNGDITASGDISSSGTITAATFNLAGGSLSTTNITASGLIRSSGSIVHGNVSASGNIVASGFISASGRLQTLSHITASGNISSSGNIIGTINGGKF